MYSKLPGRRTFLGILTLWTLGAAAFLPRQQLLALAVFCHDCRHRIRVAPIAAKQLTAAGDFCWEAASWCFQICSAGPLAAGGNQCLAQRHEASLITCLEVTYLGVCSDLAGVESCMVWQRFPEGPKAKRTWEKGSSGWGNSGGKESLLVPGCWSDRPQSISKCPKRGGELKKNLLTQTFPEGCWQEK